MYYLLLCFSSLLFSVQFLSNKYYQREMGSGLFSTSIFLMINQFSLFMGIYFLSKFNIKVNNYVLIISFVYGLLYFLCIVFGIKSLNDVNLSIYTLFMMLGGMICPFIYGIIIGEAITSYKIIGCFLFIIALILSVNRDGKTSKFGYLCCLIVFLTNGFLGILINIYVSNENSLSNYDFMFYRAVFTFIFSLLFFIYFKIIKKNEIHFPKTSKGKILCISMPILMTVVNGGGSYILLLCASNVEASVEYPIMTGGCIFLSFIWDTIFGIKITKKTIIQTIIVLAGMLLFMLN